jgi:hypothetical protein
MAEMTGTEQLPERVDRIERKLDTNVERLEGIIASNTRGLANFGRKLDRFMQDQAGPPRRRRVRRAPKKR